ncbi:Gfo/Idh/MocA family protein [Bacteroidota bacterium]
MKLSGHINWGMIGCGDVTERKSAPSFNKIDGSSLLGVMNRTMEKAIEYASRHSVSRVFEKAEDLIADPEINAIYVATPPSSHAEYAIKAMQAGKPVYVEKPMAATYNECLAMNEVSRQTGVPLFVAYYRRSMDYFLKVRELLAEKTIGQTILCHSKLFVPPRPEDFSSDDLPWRVVPAISGGGYFNDMGCHELDILLYLFGDVKKVSGHACNVGRLYSPEDTIVAAIEFESGLLYSGSWCFVNTKESASDEIEIIGSSGSIRFSCFGFTPIELCTGSGRKEYSIDPPEHVQYPMIESVIKELMGVGMSPSHGESAAKINWLMEKILALR